jgi:hypothetical protein
MPYRGYRLSAARPLSVSVGVLVLRGSLVHHPQHPWATGTDETPHEHGGQHEENDVEDRRVVPGDRCLDDLGIALGGNDPPAMSIQIAAQSITKYWRSR